MNPLDERLRNLKLIRPPALYTFLDQYCDEVTALLIKAEQLEQENQELVEQANARYWNPKVPMSQQFPF